MSHDSIDGVLVDGRLFIAPDSNDPMKVLLEEMSEGVAMISKHGTILFCNHRLAEMFKTTTENLLGVSFIEQFPEEERPLLGEAIARAEKNSFRLEVALGCKKSKAAWLSLKPIVVESRTVVGVVVIDLSSRKLIEEIVETEQFAGPVLQQVPHAVIVYDLNGRKIFANHMANSLLGKIPEYDLPLTVESENSQLSLSDALAGVASCDIQAIYHLDDGGELPVSVNMGPLVSASAGVLGCVVVLVDMREYLRIQSVLRASQEQLSQALKMEAVGNLAGGVAHDFNNILASISLLTDTLMTELGSSHRLYTYAEQIEVAQQRAASLTKQLLTFSLKQHIVSQALEVNDVLSEMHNMLLRLLREDIEFTLHPGPSVRIWCDRIHFEQICMNIVLNARDAIERVGRIRLQTRVDETHVHISVEDSGCGMDERTQQRIFEPFFTTKPVGKGTGLGLSTVFGILKQHGGQIRVESVVGRGSTFIVSFPQFHGPANVAPALDNPREGKQRVTGPLLIMLIEDDRMVRSLTAQLLRSHGHEVIEADNGVTAVDLFNELSAPLDLLITDVVMPKMGGSEVVSRIRGRFPNIPVLFLSGYPDVELEDYDIPAASVSFLPKPFSHAQLLKAIESILRAETD